MQFNVASLLKAHTGAMREYVVDDELVVDGETHHLTGDVRMDRTPEGILVRAKMSGEQASQCSRCLRDVSYEVTVAFEEEYIPTIDIDTGAQVPTPEGDDDAYRINDHHIIDLTKPVVEYWSMAEPLAPLCEEGCRGLCPVCGAVIGASDHTCTREQSDDRWAALRDMKLR